MTPAVSQMIHRIATRAVAQSATMIVNANSGKDAHATDPKVGGHPAACSSAAHILAALHLVVRNPVDLIASKPHAAPIDHIYQHHLGLFRDPLNPTRFLRSAESAEILTRLRQFPQNGESVLQSYHAQSDPDSESFLPTGSVGLPAVTLAYLALAARMSEALGLKSSKGGHFWALIGDSESREGSLMECMPDVAERELGNVTWIIDYNRQSLDGPRICNRNGLTGTDAGRLARSAEANGWRVIDLQHGSLRRALFARDGGVGLRHLLETGFSDYEFQSLLYGRDAALIRESMARKIGDTNPATKDILNELTDDEFREVIEDLGGHDPTLLIDAMTRSKEHKNRPTLIIAHTIKGWGLPSFAAPSNHSSLPSQLEVAELLNDAGLTENAPYCLFPRDSKERAFIDAQGQRLQDGLDSLHSSRRKNKHALSSAIEVNGGLPGTFGIDALSNVPLASTQWMWGQVAARLNRIGDAELRDLDDNERRWHSIASRFITVSPDVGTSTNLNPVMNDGVFGPPMEGSEQNALTHNERGRPILHPAEIGNHRHVRMDIAEGAAMSCVGALGMTNQRTGHGLFPALTIYDFFVKRALDQLFYNLYSGASFLVVGTPSGVTLSPEGAQHCWKSDIQIPGLITWEPAFAIEVDWIIHESLTRMATKNDQGRNGVLLRLVTRGVPQHLMLDRLRRHRTCTSGATEQLTLRSNRSAPTPTSDAEILASVRADALRGGYWLINWRNDAGYDAGDNVVHIAVMGALVVEAVAASDALLAEGIFANVLVVTSADELLGARPAHQGYTHLQQGLGIDGMPSADGSRIPIVGVCDGEIGLLDNLGSIVGVLQRTLGTSRHSQSGRPADIYRHHGLDATSIRTACHGVLEDAALRDLN